MNSGFDLVLSGELNMRYMRGLISLSALFVVALAAADTVPLGAQEQNGSIVIGSIVKFRSKILGFEKNFLHLTVGDEPQLKMSIDTFVARLEAMKPAGVEWQYEVKQDEDHRSVMAVILPEGLRSVFSDWKGRPSR